MQIKILTESAIRVGKAIITNQVARLLPWFYLRLTRQTGRGSHEEQPEEIAAYFWQCFIDYCNVLGISEHNAGDMFRDKRVLEYGPGDLPGVALLFYAYGAEQVFCVDRFPMMRLSAKNISVIQCLLDRLEGEARERADAAILRTNGEITGFSPGTVTYLVRPGGLAALNNAVDLVISRAVLEHVNDLKATFSDMYHSLKPGAMAVHQVDLKSHGLHRENQLDFLAWSPFLWRLMYSAKGMPNRWRVDTYRRLIEDTGFECNLLKSTQQAALDEVNQVRTLLPPLFKTLSDEDLSCLGFWVVIRKPEIQISHQRSIHEPGMLK
jgi:SAM-dependent methyltransferase